VTEDSGRAGWLRQARAYLRDADPVLARLIDERPDFDPQAWMTQLPAMDLYGSLMFQVAGQQLSVAATRTILGRIEAMFGGRLPAPAELLALDPARIREAGLSWRKIGTLRDLAERPDLLDGYHRWSQSRTDFNNSLEKAPPGSAPWQKNYFRGNSITGRQAPQHQTKLRLRDFADLTSKPDGTGS